MALQSWTPERGFLSEKMVRPASVSTSLSLELCTFPNTLGSSVAEAALEQLLAMEQSLQGDYFKCNEEMRTFLKNIAEAVKKLEEMRKNTIELLEIESMELSRLYFMLETVPNSLNLELEECVRNARKLNLHEINQMKAKIKAMDNEAEFLKKTIADLRDTNETLGEKQEELAKQYTKFVLSLNHTMEEKATATVYINETYTKINNEKEEIELQKTCLKEANELIEKHNAEYTLKKEQIATKINDFKQSCELKRKEAYSSKRELNRLQVKMTKIKQTVTTSTVVLSDHNLEIARLQESIREWEKKVEDVKKDCKMFESKLTFFVSRRETLNEESTNEKDEYIRKIKQMSEKMYKVQLENRDLREKLHNILKQHMIVLKEEDDIYLQKRKVQDEYEKQKAFVNQKESLLSQRKVDIKNMEEGLITLHDLHRATQQVYRKQVKILSDNLEREMQRCVISQWNIACERKKHARWLQTTKSELRDIVSKMEEAEQKRTELLEETSIREQEIQSFVEQIKKLRAELKEEEKDFAIKEKKLIQELTKYEDLIMKEEEISKAKEEELVDSIPQLHMAEDNYIEIRRNLQELENILKTYKQEEHLLNSYIAQFLRDFTRYSDTTKKVKEELKQLRDQEGKKIKDHFEILKNLENEIYAHDQKADLLILENKKLRKHLAAMKVQVEKYRNGQETIVKDSGDRSWELLIQHKHYADLLAKFQLLIKELVALGEETLHEIKNLTDKLYHRDETMESIGSWLQGNVQRLYNLMNTESHTDLHEQQLSPCEKMSQKYTKKVQFSAAMSNRRNALTKN